MKLLVGVGVLFAALTFRVVYTTDGHEGGDVDTLKEKVELLREHIDRVELKLLRKSNLITRLQTDIHKLRSEQASSRRLSLDLQEGLSIEKRMRQQTENELGELKTAIRLNAAKLSECQAVVVLNSTNQQRLCECPTRSHKIAGVKGEPGQKGDTGVTGLKGEPGLLGRPGQEGVKGEPGQKGDTGLTGLKGEPGPPGSPGQDGLKCHPATPGLSGQKGEPDRTEQNGTRMVLPGGLSVPVLRFIRVYGLFPDRVAIEAKGATVRDGQVKAGFTTVRTDGRLPADRRSYWETELVWRLDSDRENDWWSYVGLVGVRRLGSFFGAWPGDDSQSWAVRIRHNPDLRKWQYYCYHKAKSIVTSEPVKYTRPEVSHRLGLLLDPASRTLTAIDVDTNTLICSFPAVDAESESLVPLVEFADRNYQRRFRLLAVDPSRLPGAVTDLLLN